MYSYLGETETSNKKLGKHLMVNCCGGVNQSPPMTVLNLGAWRTCAICE
jgi:hypothetical protein